MSTEPSEKKADSAKDMPSILTPALVVSILALIVSVSSLVITLNANRTNLHFRWVQAPVGLTYVMVGLRDHECRDALIIDNTSDATLTNVVLSINNHASGSELPYQLGMLAPKSRTTLILHETSGVRQFPRKPYEMALDDYIRVTCDSYLPHEFALKDLDKRELHKPELAVPDFDEIREPSKLDGKLVACFLYASAIEAKDEWLFVTCAGSQPGFGINLWQIGVTVRTKKEDGPINPGDMLFVEGTLAFVLPPPPKPLTPGGVPNPYFDSYARYVIDAKFCKNLSRQLRK